jgi:hypothetical protein
MFITCNRNYAAVIIIIIFLEEFTAQLHSFVRYFFRHNRKFSATAMFVIVDL